MATVVTPSAILERFTLNHLSYIHEHEDKLVHHRVCACLCLLVATKHHLHGYPVSRVGSGIGQEFVRQLSTDPDNIIFAALRNPAKSSDLQLIKSSAKAEVHIIKLDVGDEEAVQAARAQTECLLARYGGSEAGLDYLLNNAGTVSAHYRFSLPLNKLQLDHVALGRETRKSLRY